MMMTATVFRLATTFYLSSVVAFGTVATEDGGTGQHLMPAILLALKEGVAGENTLLAWSSWAEDIVSSHRTPPAVWVISSDSAVAASVFRLPHVDPIFVRDETSWAAVLVRFLSQNPWIPGVGLLGEGVLPHPELLDSIESMQLALFEAVPPTAILTRSRSKGDVPGDERWLPDNFVTQVWSNRAALEATMLKKAGLGTVSFQDTNLLRVLPDLIRDAAEKGLVLVDGTHVVGSMFDTSPAPVSSSGGGYTRPSVSAQRLKRPHDASGGDNNHPRGVDDGGELYIGSLELALVYDIGDTRGSDLPETGRNAGVAKTSSIAQAAWPPEYVLETVAMNTTSVAYKGLVLVSNVNCGYLDMATNFWLSVRNTSDAKVLFVVVDEVAFDFMDALHPGCTALFPGPTTERHHSLESGTIGGSNFAEAVLVRPSILLSLLRQDYAVLWSDSDMVWLKNPLSLLPQLDDTAGADVMLQTDGNPGNKCTCFMFLKPTMMCRMLLKRWEKAIVESRETMNQKQLQKQLTFMRNAGLRVDFVPREIMPAGKHSFDHVYVKNYTQLYHEHTRIVHNNWIKGHQNKKGRFRPHHLWFVENMPFPECGNPLGDHGTTRRGGDLDLDLGRSESMMSKVTSGAWTVIWAKGLGVSTFIVVLAWFLSVYLHVFGRRGFNLGSVG